MAVVKQRGFSLIELAIALVAAAALVGAIFGGIHMWNSHMDKVRADADKAGYDRALKEVAQRDKQELLDAQGQIAALTLDRDTQAALHATSQAAAKAKHDKELANAKGETADLLRRIDTGSLVLRDPGRRAGQGGAGLLNPVGGGRGSQGETATTLADGSGQALGQGLSPTLSGFLIREFDRADEVATDLELCWGIAKDDRARLATRAPP